MLHVFHNVEGSLGMLSREWEAGGPDKKQEQCRQWEQAAIWGVTGGVRSPPGMRAQAWGVTADRWSPRL